MCVGFWAASTIAELQEVAWMIMLESVQASVLLGLWLSKGLAFLFLGLLRFGVGL